MEGGGWVEGSWGSKGIAPGDHGPQVAPHTVCRTHMEALQQFGISVGVEADTTGELVFQLPESLLTGGLCHYG